MLETTTPTTSRGARPLSVAQALDEGTHTLAAAGVEGPRRDAMALLAAAGLPREKQIGRPVGPVERDALAAYRGMVARRVRREPVSRILGRREFWSLPFAVTPDTLDPRPDSETLVEGALNLWPDRTAPLSILDLGTGTGCLLLALLSELPRATGVGADISPAALRVAQANAQALGLSHRAGFAASDWGDGLKGPFNLILANPPYIADGDMGRLEPEVALYEPRGALAGGSDGLEAYRRLAPRLGTLLAPGGHALLEVGAGQAAEVAGLLGEEGLKIRRILRDFGGIERCIIASLATMFAES
ncbi:MAG: peptide chain release factor N(5)-glutamine methyltransferase [Proteobacteria bacterium]|nr:peptide chain release factor N(5)-glutamine methyltransferase [Pseudomonadota bacterium]